MTVLDYHGISLFAELPHLRTHLPDPTGARHAVLVLLLRTAPDIPSSTILKALHRYTDALHQEDCRLVLAGVQPALADLLHRTGLTQTLGPDTLIPAEGPILAPLNRAHREARHWIATHSADPPEDR